MRSQQLAVSIIASPCIAVWAWGHTRLMHPHPGRSQRMGWKRSSHMASHAYLTSTFGRPRRSGRGVMRRRSCEGIGHDPEKEEMPKDVKRAVAWATQLFRSRGVPDPEASAEYLMLHVLHLPPQRSQLYGVAKRMLDTDTVTSFTSLCGRRVSREPLQYLVGSWDFHRITLNVRPPVLIPRPETEELVEWILESTTKGSSLRFLDVGCGSGAIGLALLNCMPAGCTCVGIDPNPAAVALARQNAKKLQLSDRFVVVESDISSYKFSASDARFDFIVSNPPYIPSKEVFGLQEEVRLYEDRGALDGGVDGVDVVRGGRGKVWMEVDVSHPGRFEAEGMGEHLADVRLVEWRKDLCGKPRFCCWEIEALL